MKSSYKYLLYCLILTSCKDFKAVESDIVIHSSPSSTDAINFEDYFEDDGDFEDKMLNDFGYLIRQDDESWSSKYNTAKEKQKEYLIKNMKEIDLLLKVKNNTEEKIEDAHITMVLSFTFNNKAFYYIKRHSILKNDIMWVPNEIIEKRIKNIPVFSLGRSKFLSQHSPTKINYTVFLSAKNSVGYSNFNSAKGKYKQGTSNSYADKYGEFKTGIFPKDGKHNIGEEIIDQDITELYNQQLNKTNDDQSKCKTSVFVENAVICLPDFINMQNISNDYYDESYIEKFAGKGNKMLAFYMEDTNAYYNNENPNYNYASIYINSKMKKDLDSSTFDKMSETMGGYLNKTENWKAIITDIENNYFENISFDVPLLIDSYKTSDKVKTYLLLGKIIEGNNEILTLTTLNLMHVKNKMILSNYIIKYDDLNSIKRIKQLNENYVAQFLNENN